MASSNHITNISAASYAYVTPSNRGSALASDQHASSTAAHVDSYFAHRLGTKATSGSAALGYLPTPPHVQAGSSSASVRAHEGRTQSSTRAWEQSSQRPASSVGDSVARSSFGTDMEADMHADSRRSYVPMSMYGTAEDDDEVLDSDYDEEEEENMIMEDEEYDDDDDDVDDDMELLEVKQESAATSARDEPSALSKLAATAVWTMLTPRLDVPMPPSLEALARSIHFALEATQLPRVMTHLALLYLHRLLACVDRADPVDRQRFLAAAAISGRITGSSFSAYHRLFTVALALADAYLDDHAYAGSAWSQVAGDQAPRWWNRFHLSALDMIHWRLEVADGDWTRWRSWLGDWWRAVGITCWANRGRGAAGARPPSTVASSTASRGHVKTPVTKVATPPRARHHVSPVARASVDSMPTPSPDQTPSPHCQSAAAPVHLSSASRITAQQLLTPSSSLEDIHSAKSVASLSQIAAQNAGTPTMTVVRAGITHSAASTPDSLARGQQKRQRLDRSVHAGSSPTASTTTQVRPVLLAAPSAGFPTLLLQAQTRTPSMTPTCVRAVAQSPPMRLTTTTMTTTRTASRTTVTTTTTTTTTTAPAASSRPTSLVSLPPMRVPSPACAHPYSASQETAPRWHRFSQPVAFSQLTTLEPHAFNYSARYGC
ncbi:hypothetical protein THASP1DRAFT_28479 [Thamnocephalis sphaerospora]|uniref:Uncharacterized protein n=1 Tax=Thamnocephalis sphaerospora TaxID=78915 RepID=A0A4V1IX41_9FUNG|nr:hypothetical protein THASP1DRAFT_28479 [Thamnocephalis sphaerospora]|eukprot:RKP09739.1 hypothetical protein THASP1DRAFT_28479 [Thamnocephalis sphaerospora]